MPVTTSFTILPQNRTEEKDATYSVLEADPAGHAIAEIVQVHNTFKYMFNIV